MEIEDLQWKLLEAYYSKFLENSHLSPIAQLLQNCYNHLVSWYKYKKIRRTKLCVSNSIAAPSYLMLFAECLTSVVNLLPQSSRLGYFSVCTLFLRIPCLRFSVIPSTCTQLQTFTTFADTAALYGISFPHAHIIPFPKLLALRISYPHANNSLAEAADSASHTESHILASI